MSTESESSNLNVRFVFHKLTIIFSVKDGVEKPGGAGTCL